MAAPARFDQLRASQARLQTYVFSATLTLKAEAFTKLLALIPLRTKAVFKARAGNGRRPVVTCTHNYTCTCHFGIPHGNIFPCSGRGKVSIPGACNLKACATALDL